MKKIVFVAGTAYCGSSLLNILLDTQNPAIRGVGERSQTDGEAGGPCILCNKFIDECGLYARWNRRRFYEFNFNHYGCSTLIDSSKRTNALRRAMIEEPQYRYFVLHMSKTPHSAAHSILKHWQHDHWDVPLDKSKRDLPAAMEVWRATNELYLNDVRGGSVEAVKQVHYDALAAAPAGTVEEICRWLGEPYDATRLDRWQTPTTHILGGNTAIFMQVLGHEVLPDGYLGGKYAERKGKIFRDEGWTGDGPFLRECVRAYRRMAKQLDPLLAVMGYGDCGAMIAECERRLALLGDSSAARSRTAIVARVGNLFKFWRAA